MKKLIILVLVTLSITSIIAQTPQAFKYQAVARDNNGDVLINKSVAFKISILKGSASGTIIFSETHNPATNSLGLVNLEIGNGTLVSGDFAKTNWGNDKYFIRIELDAQGGTNYQVMGTSQLLSVPYALYSQNTNNKDDADADSTNELQAITLSNDTIFLSNGGFVIIPPENDADPTNELQALTISNDTIFLSNGSFVKLPAVQTGSVPSNTCLHSTSITPPLGYTYTGHFIYVPDNSWAVKANMPTARSRLTVAKVNNKIYVIGGYTGSAKLNTNEEYDPATNTWITKAGMPTARHGLTSAVVNNRIYVIGGGDGVNTLNNNEEYNPTTNTWAIKANMPTDRGYLSAAVVNNKIYVIGGHSSSSGIVLSINEEYDPTTNTWTKKTDMPTSRNGCGIEVVNNKIYVIGGNNNGILSTNEEYNPAINNWTTMDSMPTPRSQMCATVNNNKIYLIGGNTSQGIVGINEEYDPASNTWFTKTSMPTARGFMSSAMVKNKIYIFGGANGNTTYSTTEEYNTEVTYYIHCRN